MSNLTQIWIMQSDEKAMLAQKESKGQKHNLTQI